VTDTPAAAAIPGAGETRTEWGIRDFGSPHIRRLASGKRENAIKAVQLGQAADIWHRTVTIGPWQDDADYEAAAALPHLTPARDDECPSCRLCGSCDAGLPMSCTCGDCICSQPCDHGRCAAAAHTDPNRWAEWGSAYYGNGFYAGREAGRAEGAADRDRLKSALLLASDMLSSFHWSSVPGWRESTASKVRFGRWETTLDELQRGVAATEAALLDPPAPASPQPLGIPSDLLTTVVETNARLLDKFGPAVEEQP
jgi:hypothetical protein